MALSGKPSDPFLFFAVVMFISLNIGARNEGFIGFRPLILPQYVSKSSE